MVTVQFYPLDITYKVENDKPVIYLFGRTLDGKRITVIDRNFEPYFYAIPLQDADPRSAIMQVSVDAQGRTATVKATEHVEKKYFGTPVTAIKVIARIPADVPLLKDAVKQVEGVKSIHEYDILFVRRYLIDRGIVPLNLCESEGTEQAHGFEITSINPAEGDLNQLKILAFDIETYNPDGKGMDMNANPIIMLSLYGKNFKKVLTWKRFATTHDYIEFVNGEVDLIERFKEIIAEYKPDILAGYFSDGFDLPYMVARAKKHSISLTLGLDKSSVRLGRGQVQEARITGINHVDIFKFIIKILGRSLDTERYSLNAVSEELLGESKDDADLDSLHTIWDHNPGKLEPYAEYNLQDSLLTYRLCEKMLPNLIELVRIVGVPLFDVNRMGFSQLIENYLLRQAPSFNEIAPNKPSFAEVKARRLQTYVGGFVYEPKPGLYNDIMIFDYRSLYPTIISSHNVDPSTLNCSCCKGQTKVVEVDGAQYWFCAKQKGFIPTLIEGLITRRQRIKEIMHDKPSPLLEARQNSLKLLANSFYGYLGFFAARWYSIESARNVTALGRYYIKDVIKKATDSGFAVLYSDTDSVFLQLNGKTKRELVVLAERINHELPSLMELEYEGHYPRGIFVSAKASGYGAKKRYALLSESGNIKIKGFESVRRNWSTIGKEVQERALDIILKEGDQEKALTYVKSVIDQLRKNEISIEKVTIQTQLQKEIGSYDAVGPHVAAARRMEAKGLPVGSGTIIKFVITRGGDKIREKAKLPVEVTQDDYDPEYYINHQIVPAVERIFDVLGYSKEDLLQRKDQIKLQQFM